ncbi:unnamed protein product [Pleuronectes platessa]|uniref:Uncharacterized protein n=1 Tax=Pleuronectes platessa TaxID=8262 RepID=A0A9N7TT92_PLEPL|nr:unnamed protein product [Pleuronectes platessa]
MKPPLGASRGPRDNNAGSQAHKLRCSEVACVAMVTSSWLLCRVTRSRELFPGEQAQLTSRRSLLKSQWPYMQETSPWNGPRHWGSGEQEHALLAHCIMGRQDPH